jgi:hypothetical protein
MLPVELKVVFAVSATSKLELPILETPLTDKLPAITRLEFVIAVRPLANVVEPPTEPTVRAPVLAIVVVLSIVFVVPVMARL